MSEIEKKVLIDRFKFDHPLDPQNQLSITEEKIQLIEETALRKIKESKGST